MRPWCAWFLLVPLACSPSDPLPALQPDPSSKSLLLLILGDPSPSAWMIDLRLGDELPAFHAMGSAPVIAAEYDESAELLRLHRGAIAVYYGEIGDPLPPPLVVSRLANDGTAWGPADESIHARIAELRFIRDEDTCRCHQLVSVNAFACDDICARPPAPTPPELPMLPASPRLGPCPAGWIPRALGDAEDVCDPPGPLLDCAVGSAQFLGDEGCRPHGEPCSGEFSDAPPPILYVRAGAPSGGDGSLAAPFGTIASALGAASPGTTLLLGRGTYDESPRLDRSVRLQGACVEGTILAVSSALQVVGATVGLDRLTIEGQAGALRVASDARVDVRASKITSDNNGTPAVRVSGTLVGAAFWIARAQGVGIRVERAAVLRLSAARIERTMGRGIDAIGAQLDLSDVWTIGTNDTGVSAEGSKLVAERLAVDGAGACGVYLHQSSTATISDYVCNGTIEEAVCLEGGELTLDRAWLSESGHSNFLISEGSWASVTDLIATDGEDLGLNCSDSRFLRLERSSFARNRHFNLHFREGCGPAEVRDMISRSPRIADNTAEGLVHYGRGKLEMQRVLVEDTIRFGLALAGPTVLTDVTVNRVAGPIIPDGTGVGIELRRATQIVDVTLERVSISSAFRIGINVPLPDDPELSCGGRAVLKDLTIADTPNGVVINCPIVDAERVAISSARFDGVRLFLSDEMSDNVAPIRDLSIIGSGLHANQGAIAVHKGGLAVERARVAEGGIAIWNPLTGRLVAKQTIIEGNVTGVGLHLDTDVSGLEEARFLDNMSDFFSIPP